MSWHSLQEEDYASIPRWSHRCSNHNRGCRDGKTSTFLWMSAENNAFQLGLQHPRHWRGYSIWLSVLPWCLGTVGWSWRTLRRHQSQSISLCGAICVQNEESKPKPKRKIKGKCNARMEETCNPVKVPAAAVYCWWYDTQVWTRHTCGWCKKQCWNGWHKKNWSCASFIYLDQTLSSWPFRQSFC